MALRATDASSRVLAPDRHGRLACRTGHPARLHRARSPSHWLIPHRSICRGNRRQDLLRETDAILESLDRILGQSPQNGVGQSDAECPGISSANAGGTTIVWLTTVADGVGPSMQLFPPSTSCTVIASEYWSTRPSNAAPSRFRVPHNWVCPKGTRARQ